MNFVRSNGFKNLRFTSSIFKEKLIRKSEFVSMIRKSDTKKAQEKKFNLKFNPLNLKNQRKMGKIVTLKFSFFNFSQIFIQF